MKHISFFSPLLPFFGYFQMGCSPLNPLYESRSDAVQCNKTWRKAFANDLKKICDWDMSLDIVKMIAEYSNASASDMLECKQWLLKQTFGKIQKSEIPDAKWFFGASAVFNIEFKLEPFLSFPGNLKYSPLNNFDIIRRFGYDPFLCSDADRDSATLPLCEFLLTENGEDRIQIWFNNKTDVDYFTKNSIKYTHFWFLPLQEESPTNILHVTLALREEFPYLERPIDLNDYGQNSY